MEISKGNKNILKKIGQYKYVLIVVVCGIWIMTLPNLKVENNTNGQIIQDVKSAQERLSQELSSLLSQIQGAGNVQVMLSVLQGELTVYQSDETSSHGDTDASSKKQTILITDDERRETGLICQQNPPVYLGAVVLAQGADDPTVRLALVDAVSKATGLGADKISVVKMK